MDYTIWVSHTKLGLITINLNKFGECKISALFRHRLRYAYYEKKADKPQQHQDEFYLLGSIQSFDKVLYYNNDKHKHTWFIKVCAKIFAEPIPNWFINWWSYHGPTVQILLEPFLNLYKEWTKTRSIFFKEFSIPWIQKWTPEIGFTEEDISCLYRTYYNKFWYKLMKQDPKTKQLISQELLDSISEKIKEYNQIPQKGIVNDTSYDISPRESPFKKETKKK
ncbi:hypothetical protein H5410_041194 [Solanum commersonii]|uniref:Uncharacterized protein n=1 Tax=Solanum commersonii TaxID=4109 RepID=A0A9J5XU37_SOLCO|nr:hypothetical protein H5410_041194 [Solanum commersonii]